MREAGRPAPPARPFARNKSVTVQLQPRRLLPRRGRHAATPPPPPPPRPANPIRRHNRTNLDNSDSNSNSVGGPNHANTNGADNSASRQCTSSRRPVRLVSGSSRSYKCARARARRSAGGGPTPWRAGPAPGARGEGSKGEANARTRVQDGAPPPPPFQVPTSWSRPAAARRRPERGSSGYFTFWAWPMASYELARW